jgi:protocatechuate 3,4-dioxygenase beta subunit
MHDHTRDLTKPDEKRFAPGTAVTGTVVCHHHFGLGMYVADHDEYGHVNITAIGPGRFRGPEDFPTIGSHVSGKVLGYTGDQLRIALWQGNNA